MYRIGLCAVLLALGAGASCATATPYWIAWEGDDFPENQGWTRVWGNWDGQYEGPGAYRTLENGILTYDSLYDLGVCDFSKMYRPGQMDPGAGEMFVMEWRLKVQQVIGRADPDVFVSSDDAWVLGLAFGYDRIYSGFEDEPVIPFAPGALHEYRVVSVDMRTYELYIDGGLAHQGVFWHSIGPSEIAWGDGVQGAASLHQWDYFRFGVVPKYRRATGEFSSSYVDYFRFGVLPEPNTLLLVVTLGACCGRRRRYGSWSPWRNESCLEGVC